MERSLEQPAESSELRPWIPLALAFGVLYVPTYIDLCRVFWGVGEDVQGIVMLALIAWLFWRQRHTLRSRAKPRWQAAGIASVGFGLACYVCGRSQFFYQFEVFSQIPLLFGIVYLLVGKDGLRKLWFPICMLVFVVPVPGSMLDPVLLPLKELVSDIVERTLHLFGYPIARDGVVLVIGPYSLLLADACSGLNSMVALSGVGALYVHVAGPSSRAVNIGLLLSTLPIAFTANIVRVVSLVLITFYHGEDAGRAFHDVAGYLEILFAFAAFFILDSLISTIRRSRSLQTSDPEPCAWVTNSNSVTEFRSPVLLATSMLIAAVTSAVLTPGIATDDEPSVLARDVPAKFGDWRQVESSRAVVDPTRDQDGNAVLSPYSDVLMRTYRNSEGDIILLALAYGKHQRQEFKIHRPELCYFAQGFKLEALTSVVFPIEGRRSAVVGKRMLVERPDRIEIVSYWIRIGSLYSDSAWSTRYHIFEEGLRGHIVDGILVRVSQVVVNTTQATSERYEIQERFLAELVRAAGAQGLARLLG